MLSALETVTKKYVNESYHLVSTYQCQGLLYQLCPLIFKTASEAEPNIPLYPVRMEACSSYPSIHTQSWESILKSASRSSTL